MHYSDSFNAVFDYTLELGSQREIAGDLEASTPQIRKPKAMLAQAE